MKIAVIKYNAGNIFSVECALKRLGFQTEITDNHDIIRAADRVIFPGVGEAGSAMNYLRQHQLDSLIKSLTQPVLGICIGQQLLCAHSEEGNTDCLGIFDVNVKKFPLTNSQYKIPHMGWNTLVDIKDDFIPHDLEGNYIYYVHSYYVPVNQHTIATTDYIVPFSAALHKDNFYATQFHPEKSGDIGEIILKNFILL